MSADVAYLDTSAFVKTITAEPESAAIVRFLQQWPGRASSKLLRLEALRTMRRLGPEPTARTRAQLQHVVLIDVDDRILDTAALLEPAALRSLDAIHLATAQLLGADLGVIVTYDERMAAGARALGFIAESPT